METFAALLALCAGNSPVTGEFPTHKSQWHGALMFPLICAWTNTWGNNGDAGDLRCHRAHYDVNVMWRGDTMSLTTSKLFLLECAGLTWWRHQMEIFSALLDFHAWNSPVTNSLKRWLKSRLLVIKFVKMFCDNTFCNWWYFTPIFYNTMKSWFISIRNSAILGTYNVWDNSQPGVGSYYNSVRFSIKEFLIL